MIFSLCFRARRVKCDERKPACSKCTTSNRKCEGYADPFRSSMETVPAPRASSTPSSSDAISRPMSDHSALALPWDAEERRYFHHFRQSCIPDLLGLVGDELWNRYMLQICESKPAVRHAILALSAQHEAFLTSSPGSNEECSPENERSVAFSCRQYGKVSATHQQFRLLSTSAKPSRISR